jgi:hypothetical protein
MTEGVSPHHVLPDRRRMTATLPMLPISVAINPKYLCQDILNVHC